MWEFGRVLDVVKDAQAHKDLSYAMLQLRMKYGTLVREGKEIKKKGDFWKAEEDIVWEQQFSKIKKKYCNMCELQGDILLRSGRKLLQVMAVAQCVIQFW